MFGFVVRHDLRACGERSPRNDGTVFVVDVVPGEPTKVVPESDQPAVVPDTGERIEVGEGLIDCAQQDVRMIRIADSDLQLLLRDDPAFEDGLGEFAGVQLAFKLAAPAGQLQS